MESEQRFFPEYLNKGSKGPAVALLQVLLKDYGYNEGAISVNGEYDEETAEGVRQLQKELEIEDDGHFGPATREAWVDKMDGPDVNAIPKSAFTRAEEYVGP
jgi:peptidoglycan hydrolase-like protein with peptidoglycan-binding domain